MDHKFRIDLIRLVEAHFALNIQYKWEKDASIEMQHSIEIKHENDDKILSVLVTVSSNSEKQPFRFTVSCQGVFTFEKIPEKDALERIAQINCASIIFPYLRESVADLTRRANIAPLNMPPMNFVALYEEKQKAVTLAAPKKPVKKSKAKK